MFKAGQSGNPAGRPKGVLNKKTKDHLAFLDRFLVEGRERFMEVFMRCRSDRAVLEAYLEALKHRLPKAESVSHVDLDNLGNLPEETIDQILELIEGVGKN